MDSQYPVWLRNLDSFLVQSESRVGRVFVASIIALLLFGIAAIYAVPATHTVALGQTFAKMAEQPFTFDTHSLLVYRILTPWISYAIGLRGELIIVTNLIFAYMLIGLVYLYFRQKSIYPTDALFAAAVITFSLVTLTTIYYGGYTDSATYLIIFIMWWSRRYRLIFYSAFLLGLFNRESILFLVPWFIFVYYKESRSRLRFWLEQLVGFGATLGLYLLFREWISSQQTASYPGTYYLDRFLEQPLEIFGQSFLFQGLGLFTVFKILWVIPVAAAISLFKNGRQYEAYGMLILILSCMSQLFFAFDSSRMATLGYLVMIVALKHLFETNVYNFRSWAAYLLLGNLIVPQLYTARDIIEVMKSFPVQVISQLLSTG